MPLASLLRQIFAPAGLVALLAPLSAPANEGEIDWATAPGSALIRELQTAANRDRAFFELQRRNDRRPRTEDALSAFLDQIRDIRTITCPQEPGSEPIHLILYEHSLASYSSDQYTSVADADSLFPSDALSGQSSAYDVFDSEGRRLRPFGDDYELRGRIADLNGDGILENIDLRALSVGDTHTAGILRIRELRPRARLVWAALVNWDAPEWAWRLREEAGEAFPAIELGPRVEGEFRAKAAFRWDARARAYRGPTENPASHFRLLKPSHLERQVAALAERPPVLPTDPDYVDPLAAAPSATPPPARAYAPRSLADASDSELLRLMGRGRIAYQHEELIKQRSRLPAGFWRLEPKAAALALAEINRSPAHRARFRLAVDDRDGEAPPAVCTLAFTHQPSRCSVIGWVSDTHSFLRADPEGSYFIQARVSDGGARSWRGDQDRDFYDLSLAPLPYTDARRIIETLWWLNRVRSQEIKTTDGLSSGSLSFSTGDGFGELVLRDAAGAPRLAGRDTLWCDEIPERWSGDYQPETFLNFADYLITRVLPKRVELSGGELETDATTEADTRLRQRAVVERILAELTPAQDRLSPPVGIAAVEAAGEWTMAAVAPRLEALRRMDFSTPGPRTYEIVDAEMRALREKSVVEPRARAERERALRALAIERKAAPYANLANKTQSLREAVEIALRQIATADDPDALQNWAIHRDPGYYRALRRLAETDPARHVETLAALTASESNPRQACDWFAELTRVAPARAAELRPTLSPEIQKELPLADDTPPAGPDESPAPADLIAIILDPGAGWQKRGAAIDRLAPRENPLLHPEPEVDAALLRALDPALADKSINFTQRNAARALARRGRAEAFAPIANAMTADDDTYLYGEILGSLTHLAQADPARLDDPLAALIAPHLRRTNKRVTETLWAIWAADLRRFAPDLERLGTAGPEDYEDARAQSSGGKVEETRGRFHLARQISDIWRAETSAIRARLLVACAAAEPFAFSAATSYPERRVRLFDELRDLAPALDAEDRQRLDALLALGLERDAASHASTRLAHKRLREEVRETLVTGHAMPGKP